MTVDKSCIKIVKKKHFHNVILYMYLSLINYLIDRKFD